jgi:hypothetical protein
MGSKNMNDFMKKFKLKGKIIEPVAGHTLMPNNEFNDIQ